METSLERKIPYGIGITEVVRRRAIKGYWGAEFKMFCILDIRSSDLSNSMPRIKSIQLLYLLLVVLFICS